MSNYYYLALKGLDIASQRKHLIKKKENENYRAFNLFC